MSADELAVNPDVRGVSSPGALGQVPIADSVHLLPVKQPIWWHMRNGWVVKDVIARLQPHRPDKGDGNRVRVTYYSPEAGTGRPESRTRTRRESRRRTSRTVAFQEDPCRGRTSMEHPTNWAGRVSGRSQAEPQPPPGILAGCQPAKGLGREAVSLSGGPPAESVAGKSRSRASSRTWRAQADTLRCRSWRRAARRRKTSAGRRTWRAGLRGTPLIVSVVPVFLQLPVAMNRPRFREREKQNERHWRGRRSDARKAASGGGSLVRGNGRVERESPLA